MHKNGCLALIYAKKEIDMAEAEQKTYNEEATYKSSHSEIG